MSLVVPCTGCPAKLSAPESAAGKQLRCPKCKAVVPVPAFVPAEEVPVVEATIAAVPRKAVRPASVNEEEDERPKKKPRRTYDEDDRPR
ncbi:MAG TPA: hypothetical protein VGE74_02640, partial [Gemmata sp.]